MGTRGEAFDFEAAPAADLPEVWSVAELNKRIGQLLGGLGRVQVRGEISRVSRASSGHVYFDLKDSDSKLACKLWRNQVPRALTAELREGDAVVVHGRLDVYAPQGAYSLIVERVEPEGLGALLVRLEALKAELKARGWLDRKRPLPVLPRTVGVVTSRDGAALADFLRTRSQRWPLYPVRLAHTPVQGAGSAEAIARALRRLDASGVDVLVVCRGGGSLEDLWAFNELAVAEAIYQAKVPVVSGVGHETDTTLADLVADRRAHTPTDAATLVIPDRAAHEGALAGAAGHLALALDRRMERYGDRLERAERSRKLQTPAWITADRAAALERLARGLTGRTAGRLAGAGARLGEIAACVERHGPRAQVETRVHGLLRIGERLRARVETVLVGRERRAAVAGGTLHALDPQAILERGYSITFAADGRTALRAASEAAPGDILWTQLAAGRVRSRTEQIDPAPPQRSSDGASVLSRE